MNIDQAQHKGRILIVDDERINRQVLVSLLDDYECILAKDGEQALSRALSDTPPDLILLDVVMPKLDGYEVCRRLKKDTRSKDIPVIFITVKGKVEEETSGLELGAVDYIGKPFNPAIVKARVANHIELKRQRDLLTRLNNTDALTEIANRRRFDEYLAKIWKLAWRTKSTISLMVIDIDYFKLFNDRYGHVSGDDCLTRVARVLERCADRDSDLVARYGGEEFAVVLASTDRQGVQRVAEQMLEVVMALSIPHEDSEAADVVTISIGCASAEVSADMSAETLFDQADRALYQAKANGRNRIELSD
ncbi:MAG: diguanylate cyclase [Motiliproteus sp.]|nr:diguanylate cyclase [Motiliproteus sp.]MCW9053906.1 diguanylate cyclase [Motiliproteus sp.]